MRVELKHVDLRCLGVQKERTRAKRELEGEIWGGGQYSEGTSSLRERMLVGEAEAQALGAAGADALFSKESQEVRLGGGK